MNRNRNEKPPFNAVRNFIKRLRSPNHQPMLTEPMDETKRMSWAQNRAAFARDLLSSDHFQEVIQMMNEEVVSDIVETEPLDTDRLTMLRLRLSSISEFQHRLVWFIEEYEALLVEDEQRRRAEEEQDRLDRNPRGIRE